MEMKYESQVRKTEKRVGGTGTHNAAGNGRKTATDILIVTRGKYLMANTEGNVKRVLYRETPCHKTTLRTISSYYILYLFAV